MTLADLEKTVRVWKVTPTDLPVIDYRCAGCSCARRFYCSGNFRVNANGKQLDVWLIYRCEVCDKTLNIEIIERATFKSIPVDDHESYQQNDPLMVRRVAFDDALFRRLGYRVDNDVSFEVQGEKIDLATEDAAELIVQLSFDVPPQTRLDRLLSQQMGLSRKLTNMAIRQGAIAPKGGGAIKRKLSKPMTLRLDIVRLKKLIAANRDSADAEPFESSQDEKTISAAQ